MMVKTKMPKNNTTIFIVPTLKIPKKSLEDNNFINGFISDENRDCSCENCVYLLFNPPNLDRFREFVDSEYARNSGLIEDYDYLGNYVVLMYQLNPEYYSDYALIKKGRYSEVSEEYKNLFPKVVKIVRNGLNKDELSLQVRIFKKTEDMVKYWEDKLGVRFEDKMEVWSTWEEKEETLNIAKI